MATQLTLNDGSLNSAGALALKTNGTTQAINITTGQQVEFNDGSGSAPSITNTGDNNTGLFFPDADTVGITTGGTERARVDSSGNLGLGVTPSAWGSGSYKGFQIGGSASFMGRSGGSDAYFMSNTYFDQTNYRYVASLAAARYTQSGGEHQWYNAASGTAGNAITFTQAMTLDASGNLLVGGTSARDTGGTRSIAINSGALAASLDLTCSSGRSYAIYTSSAATGLQFYDLTAGAERARIDSSGNLLVGKTSADTTSAGLSLIKQSAGYGQIVNVKTVSGSGYNALANYYNGTYIGGIDFSNTATSFPTSSDIRLKKDIVDANSASAKIDQIRIVSHGWKHDDEVVEFGVIAQELNLVAPQAVIAGNDGEEIEKTWGVDYSKLVPMLIKAHQEQQAIITQLQADVAALKGNA